jgi:benzoate-CoA ligase family protein
MTRAHEEPQTAFNATVDLLERNLAAGRGGAPYLRERDRIWTYDEVVEGSNWAGAGLLDLGLEPGDRVMLTTRDRPEFVITFWGAMKAGLVPVPVPDGLSAEDLRFLISDSEAGVVVCDTVSAPTVSSAVEDAVPYLIAGDGPIEQGRRWADVCARPMPLPPAPTTRDDIALWLYTSGTTGLPKAVMHRHRHLEAASHGLAEQVVELTPDDIVLSASKMYFAYGLGNSVYLPASVGASVVVQQAPVIPAAIQSVLDRMQPTVTFGVPSFFSGLVRQSDTRLPPSIRMALSAGEALRPTLWEGFRDRFGLELLDGLGSTEALHHVTSNRPGDVVPGSAGPPLHGYEIEARDRDGQPVPDGQSGELWVRGATTFAGYWRRPELTARAYAGDWMRTGDLVKVREGRVFHEGRLDDLVKLGGIWVAPSEIEDVIRGHPDVLDAAVVAAEDDEEVPVLRAFVVSQRDDRELRSELSQLCRRRLARFKVPRSFEIVPELPRTATGKLRRFVLRGHRGGGTR